MVDLSYQYGDLWYIETRGDGDKRPKHEWGGYSQEFDTAERVYSHADLGKLPGDHYAVCGVQDQAHMSRSLLVFDLDVHKAADDDPTPERVKVDGDVPLIKSQNGGFHVPFILTNTERNSLQDSDFEVTQYLSWDVDIKGSAVGGHVVAPADIPGVDSGYKIVKDAPIPAVSDPRDACARVRLNDDPLLEYKSGGGYGGDYGVDRDTDPPAEMPTCYHAGLQLREASPDSHPNTHKVNTLTALCGLAAGYSVDEMVDHFCEDFAPGENADRQKTRYQLEHMAEKMDRGDLAPPAVSTLREYGILDDTEKCSCEIEYHGGSPTQEMQAATDGGAVASPQTATSGAGDIGPPGWDKVRSEYQKAGDNDTDTDKNDARFAAAGQLLAEFHFANREDDDTLYVYKPDSGVYEDTGESEIRQRARTGLEGAFARQEVSELTEHIRAAKTFETDEFGGPEWHICVDNGVLRIDPDGKAELVNHSHEHLFLNKAGTRYDPDADCPRWKQYLQETVKSETHRKKLQEYAGYALHHWGLPEHKALFLVGPQASGKSTFADTIRALLGGADNVASMAPQQMTSRFGTAELFGAWANIRNDIPPDTIEETGTFKEIVAGDPIKAENKGKPLFHFRPTAKHIFSANQLPDAEEDDGAFYRRVLLVPFPTTIPREQRDKSLDSKLRDELPGILNWALEGLSRLLRQDGFTGDLSVHETAETWDKWGNTVDRFAKACLETSTDATPKPKADVYQVYQRFCDAESFPAETQRQLTRRLKTEHGIQDGHATVDGRQQRCFLNVSYTSKGEQYRDTGTDDTSGAGLDSFD
jgi:P4 family phage/plasmid primase-like protien